MGDEILDFFSMLFCNIPSYRDFFSTKANILFKNLVIFPLLATFEPFIIISITFAKRTARLDYSSLNFWNEEKREVLEKREPKINHLILGMSSTFESQWDILLSFAIKAETDALRRLWVGIIFSSIS